MLFKALSFIALAATAVVASRNFERSLPSGTVTCGDNRYSVSAIEAAINAGVEDMDDNDFPGTVSSSYF